MSTETPVKSVKGSNPKSNKKFGNYRPATSAKETGPLNDVTYFDEKKREYITIKGLTEAQKVAEGYMAPLAWQGQKLPVAEGETNYGGTVGRFQLSKEEHEAVNKAIRLCKPKPVRTRVYKHSKNEATGTLIVHVSNLRRRADFKDFKIIIPPATTVNKTPVGFRTTYSFPDVKSSEIYAVISTIVRTNRNDPKDNVMNYVNKYYFRGKEYQGDGPGKNK